MTTPDIIISEEVKTAVGKVLSKCTCIHVGAETIEAACLAMLNNWPGSYLLAENDSAVIRDVAVVILPLPHEKEPSA